MSTLSRHYLSAMGIDTWELRRPLPATDAVALPAASVESTAVDRSTIVPLHRTTLTTLGKNIAAWPVAFSRGEVRRNTTVVLVESPLMEQADHDLLTSMLGAIQLQPEHYVVAQLTDEAPAGDKTVVCEDFITKMQPAAILLMAKLPDSMVLRPLDNFRTGRHLVDWFHVAVSVTLHPRDLINNPAAKRPAWEDLKRFKAELDA